MFISPCLLPIQLPLCCHCFPHSVSVLFLALIYRYCAVIGWPRKMCVVGLVPRQLQGMLSCFIDLFSFCAVKAYRNITFSFPRAFNLWCWQCRKIILHPFLTSLFSPALGEIMLVKQWWWNQEWILTSVYDVWSVLNSEQAELASEQKIRNNSAFVCMAALRVD